MLVRTGVYRAGDETNGAAAVVDGVKEAVDDAKGASELAACFGRLGVHIFAAVAFGITGGAWLVYFAHHELRRAMWYRISVYAYTAALAGSATARADAPRVVFAAQTLAPMQSAISLYVKLCLLYTSPSPRD